jgi:hypothetical protein
MKILLVLAITIFFFLISCTNILGKDEKLTLTKENYSGNIIKLDGYYYSVTHSLGVPSSHVYFLYRNGVIRYFGSFKTDSVNELDSLIKSSINTLAVGKSHWGLFQIIDSMLTLEKWVSDNGGVHKVTRYDANILTKTTFKVFKIKSSKGDVLDRDLNFNFHPFSPKPDSTNDYIP